MKKIIFLICLLFFTLKHNAQLPDGTMAPDFTGTDLNGNSHTLSSYLNSGKAVILEFSGVACGPCWRYKKTEALQDLYNAFGPPGSNELMVLQVEDYGWEGNYSSTYNELHGISDTGADEFGNWVEGTPFPIILALDLMTPYAIEYIPTIFRICPAGTTKVVGQLNAYNLRNVINNDCGSMTGVQNYARVIETENGFCTAQGSFKAKFKNYGSNNITHAVFNLKKDGIVVGTKEFTDNLAQFAPYTIFFDEIDIDASADYTIEIASVNGASNFNPEFSQANLPFHISVPSGTELLVKVHANDRPEYISWNITDASGVVAGGGPYTVPAGTYNYNANAIIEHNISLPNTAGCYTLNLISASGYGWKKSHWGTPLTVTPGIEIYSGGNLIYSNLNVGNFGSVLSIQNFLSTGLLNLDDKDAGYFAIFPNPASGIITINSKEAVKISIFDMMGKEVFYSADVVPNSSINLSHLSNGIYIVKATGLNNENSQQKLIIAH